MRPARTTGSDDEATGRWVWVDLRLAPVAAAVWAVCAVAPLLSSAQLALGAAGTAGLAAVVARRAHGRTAALVLAVLAGLAVALAMAALRESARESSPLRSAAEAGRTVELVLELDGDPHVLPGRRTTGRGGRDRTVLTDGADEYRLDAEVLVFAPSAEWRDVPAGQPIRVRAGLSAPRPR